jgi:hypothetical protein
MASARWNNFTAVGLGCIGAGRTCRPISRAGLKAGDMITEVGKAPGIPARRICREGEGESEASAAEPEDDELRCSVAKLRAALTTPPKSVLQGGEVSPLLEGASFGPTDPGASMSDIEIVVVQSGSKAAMSGLRKGDVITSVNQEPERRSIFFNTRRGGKAMKSSEQWLRRSSRRPLHQ